MRGILVFLLTVALFLALYAGVWAIYSACVVPLGAPSLGYWQTVGILCLLGFVGSLFRGVQ